LSRVLAVGPDVLGPAQADALIGVGAHVCRAPFVQVVAANRAVYVAVA
jgi:hypothetical protein